MRDWCDKWLVGNWRQAHWFWTVQLAIFWSALSGVMMAWPAMIALIPVPWFLGLSIVFSVALGLARVFKQPGIES